MHAGSADRHYGWTGSLLFFPDHVGAVDDQEWEVAGPRRDYMERAPLLADVPSLGEAALPGFQYDGWFGVWAPAKTPRKTVTAISREIGRLLDLPDVKARIVHASVPT